MPIYEYRCANCGRKNTLFTPSINSATQAEAKMRCEKCGSAQLRRLFSRFSVGKAALSEGDELYEFDRMTAGLDENDPGQLSNWARSLSDKPEEVEDLMEEAPEVDATNPEKEQASLPALD